jgi:hypothetical protein
MFPSLSAHNLEGRLFNLPENFESEWNLLFVPFLRWQQMMVDSWTPFAKELEQKIPGLVFYELPVLDRLYSAAAGFIDGGMRGGIPDRRTREKTITLYIHKRPFFKALGIESEKEIHVLLVDRQGSVFWHNQGAYSSDKAADLLRTLDDLSKKDDIRLIQPLWEGSHGKEI